jgi:D-threo-aldose 1-dehydrogenase
MTSGAREMNPFETNSIGRTGLGVTRLGLGGAALGGMYTEVSEAQGIEAVHRALDLGTRYFDTAPLYGHGKSERYLGAALSGVPRLSYVLSTKVGRVLEPRQQAPDDEVFANLPPFAPAFDFSRDGVRRSLEDSLKRLKLDSVEIALIHDPDEGESTKTATFGEPTYYAQALNETYPALVELRSQGAIKAIGVGMNQWQALARFADDADFDCFLLAGRYNLLDQSALNVLLPLCEEKQISVLLGGPYASGILASDLSPGARYLYAEAPPGIIERVRRIKAVCDRHGAPLMAAALQFGLFHPAVAAIVPGARSAEEVEKNTQMVRHPVPAQLWEELRHEQLIPRDAPTPK